jgi:EAL domain-containing protein (putative c-di-GMP-specific phosphodiesterase class I)
VRRWQRERGSYYRRLPLPKQAKAFLEPLIERVSPLQLKHSDFIAVLEQAVGSNGERCAPLDIEITEGVFMEKTDEVI